MKKKKKIEGIIFLIFLVLAFSGIFYRIFSSYFEDYIALLSGVVASFLFFGIVIYMLDKLVKRKKKIEKQVDEYFRKK